MRGCLLHFGMHKTGSTSLQCALYRWLDDDHFYYIDLGSENCSSALATAFMVEPWAYQSNERLGKSREQVLRERSQIRQQLCEQLQRAGERTAILSAEVLCRFQAQELQDLCDVIALAQFQPIARGYIRAPFSYMNSRFQQRLKEGSELDTLAPEKLYPRYRRRFEKFENVLGRSNVQFWLFNPDQFPSNCVVRDFCQRFGISIDPARIKRENQSLSRNAVALLYAYRKFGPGFGQGPTVLRENLWLVRKLASLTGSPLRFHASVVRPILEANLADMAWMESRLGASLGEALSNDPQESISDVHELLEIPPGALDWLLEALGVRETKGHLAHRDLTPQAVALLVHELRCRFFSV